MSRPQLAETLFGTCRRRVLAVLLVHPERSFHVRELARLADVSPGSLHRELRRLWDCGILERHSVGNQIHYQANRACPVFPELSGFFRKTAGLADVLREALAPLSEHIEFAFVFGSMASGDAGVFSDVDLMVVGDVSYAQVVGAVFPTHESLAREVNPVVHSPGEFRDSFLQAERFVSRIVEEPKIFLIGSDDDLGKLVGDRPGSASSKIRSA